MYRESHSVSFDDWSRVTTLAPEPTSSRAARHVVADWCIQQGIIGDVVDTYRDLLTGAMDVYLSTVSNRVSGVTKQLAVIATVFLPLTFVTGFFGQNFPWMIAHIGGVGHFVAFGIGLELMTLAIVLGFFWRRGWIVSR